MGTYCPLLALIQVLTRHFKDYLRRSGATGYLVRNHSLANPCIIADKNELPLSGGIDSCSTAICVYSMANMVHQAIQDGNQTVLADARRIAGAYESPSWIPDSPKAIVKGMFHTVYMGVRTHSSAETRKRAKDLAEAIGSFHVEADIDDAYKAFVGISSNVTGFNARFSSQGGSNAENLA